MSEYIETDDASYFRVRRQAYVSAELHRRELHEIFDDSWLYAAHLSELREPGDFITRDVGGRNLIIQRRADGEPAVYLNACAHRGAKVCAERQGNSQRFTCPYHGWTYDSHGSLIGLPDKAAYQHAGQCHPELSLTRVKHAVYRNFLFIHYAARQPSLETYLGQAKDYIDLICDQSEAELEIIPGGFEHSIKANWKLLAENGVDAYHLPFAHKRYLEYLNTLGTDPESHKRHGRGEALGNGHALIISGPPSTGRPIAYWSPLFPEALKPSIAAKFERLVERFGQARAEDIAHTNSSWDEPYAQLAANFLGTPHRTVLVAPEEVLEQDEAVLQARDLPGWGELDASLYLLFRQIREHTTVALSGESADEVFGGYPFFHDPSALAHDGFPWLAGKSGPWQLLRREVAERVAAPEYIRARYREALAEVPRLDGEDAAQRRQREVAYLALSRWLPAMLERKDRMSMAVGLEVRVPFCDHRLVEYVWNLPWALKSVAGESKSLLRRALRGHLPQAILERRKSGFPANPDPRYLALLRERVGRLLDDGRSPLFELVDAGRVRQALEQGTPLPSPRASASPTAGLAYLLNLDRWLTRHGVDISL